MKQKEKDEIIDHFEDKCECREDDNCGCSFPNNTKPDYEARCPKNINQKDCCKKLVGFQKRPDIPNRPPLPPDGTANL